MQQISIPIYRSAPWLWEKHLLGTDLAAKLPAMAAMSLISILWGFAFAFGYALLYRGIPSKGWSRGVIFGLMAWALSILPLGLLDLQLTKIPPNISLVTRIALSLPVMLILGAVCGFIYPGGRRKIVEEDIEKVGHSLSRDAGATQSRGEIMPGSPWRLIPAVVAMGIFLVAWVYLGNAVISRPFMEKTSWLWRNGLPGPGAFIGLRWYQVIGIVGILGYWVLALMIVFLFLRRGLPGRESLKGTIIGATFGVTMVLPLNLFLIPLTRMPTDLVLITFTLIPIVALIVMGAILGLVFEVVYQRNL